jgi:hypothetical protein
MRRNLRQRLALAFLAFSGAAGCGPEATHSLDVWETGTLGQPVVAVTDEPPSALLQGDVNAVLAEHQALPVAYPELMPAHFQPNLGVTADADVWVTFFSEGAGHRNALGYFTWPEGQPPTTAPSLTTRKANIIFANASASGSGGTLVQGNRMHLGRFPAGSRVGFFLIANACGGDTGCTADTIDYTKPTYYTLDALNPEATRKRHVVLVNHSSAQRHVLAFEDLNREGTNPTSDDDFNDVVFVISYNPVSAVSPSGMGIDPDSSCQAVKTRYPSSASGVYRLDPCGNGVVSEYYCDMTTPGEDGRAGGWTLGGWQLASAKTGMGAANRGTVGAAEWSRSLACIPFSEGLVFNKTYNESFSQVLPDLQPGIRQVPYAMGVAGRSFVQGTYGPSDSLVMQGCVRYGYDNALSPAWGCVTDWTVSGSTASGHIADYALEWSCNPAVPNATWAWGNDTTCKYAGVAYTWGIGVR